MVAELSPEMISEHPPELIRFVSDEAERDADEVIQLLTVAGLTPLPGETAHFPPGMLLDLAAFVRLRRWEASGLSISREARLPSAAAVLWHVINYLTAAVGDPSALSVAGDFAKVVFDLAVTGCAWTARPELGADILLDVIDEDLLVETFAQLLWTFRHDIPPVKGDTPL
ncbi:hypothetical protein [Zavarzinella formosa]|uniref:hypothetical protein n=1 Tax=Zavarzinella formosa TaxID=360055 RepID=UPI0003079996|nr:hypothetical protein [Zavarzinella formosa]